MKEYRKRTKWISYQKDYRKKYLLTRREILRKVLGGKCYLCAFKEALNFHHINPRNGKRVNNFSFKHLRSGEVVLLCPNHHHLIHHSNLQINKEEVIEYNLKMIETNKHILNSLFKQGEMS